MRVKKNQTGSSVSIPEVKILIIEDTSDHLEDMQFIVNGIDGNNREFIIKIDTAKSKEEAEKKLFEGKSHYHVLIVDIMLGPYMDGGMEIIERLNELKNEGDKEAILVITGTSFVVSHRFDGLIRQRARKAGVKAYFPKPIPIKEFRKILLETIQVALKG
jgi:CheY-like chemotaxis protein